MSSTRQTDLERLKDQKAILNSYGDSLLDDFKRETSGKKKRLKKTHDHLKVRKKLLNKEFIGS